MRLNNVRPSIPRGWRLYYNGNGMRLKHLAGAAVLVFSALLWAQGFPALDNQVPELRVTEVLQSGNGLKVTVQNISSRTIRGLSIVLGKHKVDKDWSGLPSGGLLPNASASLTVSTAGLPLGGTRHHAASPGTLEVIGAVFADSPAAPTQLKAESALVAPLEVRKGMDGNVPTRVVAAPAGNVPASAPKVEPAPKAKLAPAVVMAPEPKMHQVIASATTENPPQAAAVETESTRREVPVPVVVPLPSAPSAIPPTPTVQVTRSESSAVVDALPPPRISMPKGESAQREGPGPVVLPIDPPVSKPVLSAPPLRQPSRLDPAPVAAASPAVATSPNEDAKKPASHLTGQPGTREQGSKEELAKLMSLVETYEPDMTSYPRQTLRKMVAAVVKEQNSWVSQSGLTEFDQGRLNALQTFAYGLQTIQGRRDLDDDTLREQVGRFLKNRRQLLAAH